MTLWPSPWPESSITVLDDFTAEAAGLLAVDLRAAIRNRGIASVVLAGGGTPQHLYRGLASSKDIAWERVHFFWGDERLVPPDDPGSNFHGASEALLDRIAIPDHNIHRIRGELPATAAVADYLAQLSAFRTEHDPGAPHGWPRFDLVLLGLGEDGHTASLFPGTPTVTEPVIAVSADYQGRPAGRVTLTPLAINDARHVIFMATGANKARAVRDTWRIDDPARFPARRIQPAGGRVSWWLDRAAAAGLRPG